MSNKGQNCRILISPSARVERQDKPGPHSRTGALVTKVLEALTQINRHAKTKQMKRKLHEAGRHSTVEAVISLLKINGSGDYCYSGIIYNVSPHTHQIIDSML